jgi:aminopeptidase YwaD
MTNKSVVQLLSGMLIVLLAVSARAGGQASNRTSILLPGNQVSAIAAEINGSIAKDTIIELGRSHRVQGSSGFSKAAAYIAARAKEFGLQQVNIERFPADGKKKYYTLKSSVGWEAGRGELWEVSPRKARVADYDEMRVALADYSQSGDVTAELIDAGAGVSAADYNGLDVKGKIVLAGGSVMAAHKMACDERGAAGVLSYQQNQITGWSGDYIDNVRWGHLSPYNPDNKFAFMISLRKAREYRDRLARGEKISLHSIVEAEMRPAEYEVVTALIPGTDLAGEEIVFSCHLCHQKPGANDDASGAAAILEVARTLSTLIRRGEIEKPRRTIRFVWPPEITGTVAYFASHPEIVRRMKAAVHLDMVGGSFEITKSVLHLTHTPASLPSCVNEVGDIFTEYAINGSLKAAMNGNFQEALISPEGSKDSLVADITPFEMGSDHDVYEEGSFRIPTIYLRDWPDVFIHTNNDTPANIDPTKMKRSAFIAGASGYFLARAGAAEAARLAEEIFVESLARVPSDHQRAVLAERAGAEGIDESRNIISHSVEMAQATLSTVLMFAQGDKGLAARIDDMLDQLTGAWLVLTGKLSQQHKGKKTFFVLEPKELAPPREAKEQPAPKNPKDASRPRSTSPFKIVPVRRMLGPMNIYYYDFVSDHARGEDMKVVERIAAQPHGDIIEYEMLNLVDGKRTIQDIRDYVAAAYGPVAVEDVLEYLRVLDKIGVVQFTEK